MKNAILYIRVSTDEQASHGYSQRNQQDVLEKYCEFRGIAIAEVIYEDHSAKTFKRPEWQRMLTKLKKDKVKQPTQLILFTRWDRFSRNTADAYQMITELRRLGVEPQAIEQPLDPDVPENKMMLAFYLAVPEVENDRRALNVQQGIRRAKKEGRWPGMAPIGYINRSTETGYKYIRPEEPAATLMRTAFAEIATGAYAVEEVYQRARRNGLRCVKQNFWYSIRNPVYCGKIIVPAYKGEPLQLAEGQHEPLITEKLFDQVQLVLERRKRYRRNGSKAARSFPLRGILLCPVCGRRLTASSSRGRSASYDYYHCLAVCGVRYSATDLEKQWSGFLQSLQLRRAYLSLYEKVIKDVFLCQGEEVMKERERLSGNIIKLESRIDKARDLLLNGHIDPDDFQRIKINGQSEMAALQFTLNKLPNLDAKVNALINDHREQLLTLPTAWLAANAETKSRILRQFFPQNIVVRGEIFNKAAISPVLLRLFK